MSPLTGDEQRILLRIAREAAEAAAAGRPLPTAGELPAALRRECGVFVTLHKAGRLRGCIGQIEAHGPLARTLQECARSAALDDPRFDPVRPVELPELRIEISLLSPPEEIEPDQVEVGKHGLIAVSGKRRGLLLPQVATEWNWNREQFLDEVCLKAGLPRGAWQHGAKILSFTAEVFAESASPAIKAQQKA